MTVVDERTPGLSLALPHPDNKLQDDVLRVRQALTAIDAASESLAGILATKVDSYTKQFSRLETLINQMNSQSSMLSGLTG